MATINEFIGVIKAEFPDDRLTYQKAIPTFHPESAFEASQLFKLAGKHSQRLYITGYGNNIDPIGEPFTNMLSVRTDRLNDILELSPADLYAKVGSGYPLRELNRQLKEHKLFLPHSDLPYVGSVGGALAVGLGARLDKHDLPLRKYFIQAEIVTPDGEIITPGSVCFKSVSGYDIVKIFAGSWGLLGLIVSATFRILPESARDEFADMTQNKVDRQAFLAGLDSSNESADADYSRKIKGRFDPESILPILS